MYNIDDTHIPHMCFSPPTSKDSGIFCACAAVRAGGGSGYRTGWKSTPACTCVLDYRREWEHGRRSLYVRIKKWHEIFFICTVSEKNIIVDRCKCYLLLYLLLSIYLILIRFTLAGISLINLFALLDWVLGQFWDTPLNDGKCAMILVVIWEPGQSHPKSSWALRLYRICEIRSLNHYLVITLADGILFRVLTALSWRCSATGMFAELQMDQVEGSMAIVRKLCATPPREVEQRPACVLRPVGVATPAEMGWAPYHNLI